MKKSIFCYDYETLKSFFCGVYKSRKDGVKREFIVHKSKNELSEMIAFVEQEVSGLIGFNNTGFDYPILHYILENKHTFLKLNAEEAITRIYNKAQDIISSQNSDNRVFIWDNDVKIPQLDLYKIHHYDNRAKSCGLKWVQYSMDWHNIEEMPIHHDADISEEQIPLILAYCHNDVDSTDAFFDITLGNTEHPEYKGKNKIELRKNIQAQFDFNCDNYNDVKIGDTINQITYLKRTGLHKRDLKFRKTVRDKIYFKDCIAPYIGFQTLQLQNFLETIRSKSITNTKGEFKESLEFGGRVYSFRTGGIHSEDKPCMIIPQPGELLEDRDISSQYPATIINNELYPDHLGPEWLEGYKWIFHERIAAKGRGKKDKAQQAIAEAFKLSLNGGGYGKLNEDTSWQRDSQKAMFVTISCQLVILMLIEQYVLNNIKIISANTDGVLILYNEEQKEIVERIDKEWQAKTNYQLEYALYTKFIQTSVNDYLAIKDTGEVKLKGDFLIDFELHKNKSFRVVPIALKEYFVNGTPVEHTILNHQNIFDFCGGIKSQRDFYYELRYPYTIAKDRRVERLQKTNRYYITTDKAILKKCKQDKNVIKEAYVDVHPHSDQYWYSKVYNRHTPQPMEDYHIEFGFYIWKANKIIQQIKEAPKVKLKSNQLQLF